MELSFRTPFINLLQKFGDPHLRLPPVIHVAGTNGKGSIIAMARAILEAAGYSVHVYTSPHLVRFNERIVIAGEEITDAALEELIDEALAHNDGADITFFEITTAMAFAAFSRSKADVLLLEVGLGGRLDCTNIIPTAAASVVHTVSYDHMEFLGGTLEDIAREKMGIVKAGVPCVVGPQSIDASLFREHAKGRHSQGYIYGEDWHVVADEKFFTLNFKGVETRFPNPVLQGAHQVFNAGSAIMALKVLSDQFPVSDVEIAAGLMAAQWPARLQNLTHNYQEILPQGWSLYLDGGHNAAAAEMLAGEIAKWDEPVHLIMGMMKHKDPQGFLAPLLDKVKSITVTDIAGEPQALKAADLGKLAGGVKISQAANPQEAIDMIVRGNANPGRILIAGSLYLAQGVL